MGAAMSRPNPFCDMVALKMLETANRALEAECERLWELGMISRTQPGDESTGSPARTGSSRSETTNGGSQ